MIESVIDQPLPMSELSSPLKKIEVAPDTDIDAACAKQAVTNAVPNAVNLFF